MERMRAAEAIAARDVIAQHLSLACKTIREKSAIIDTLRQQNKYLEDNLKEHTSSTLALAPASSALARPNLNSHLLQVRKRVVQGRSMGIQRPRTAVGKTKIRQTPSRKKSPPSMR